MTKSSLATQNKEKQESKLPESSVKEEKKVEVVRPEVLREALSTALAEENRWQDR